VIASGKPFTASATNPLMLVDSVPIGIVDIWATIILSPKIILIPILEGE